jgi:hypothetical protein
MVFLARLRGRHDQDRDLQFASSKSESGSERVKALEDKQYYARRKTGNKVHSPQAPIHSTQQTVPDVGPGEIELATSRLLPLTRLPPHKEIITRSDAEPLSAPKPGPEDPRLNKLAWPITPTHDPTREDVQPTVEEAQSTVEEAQPTVEEAQPTVEEAQPTVEEAQLTVEDAQLTVPPTEPWSRHLLLTEKKPQVKARSKEHSDDLSAIETIAVPAISIQDYDLVKSTSLSTSQPTGPQIPPVQVVMGKPKGSDFPSTKSKGPPVELEDMWSPRLPLTPPSTIITDEYDSRELELLTGESMQSTAYVDNRLALRVLLGSFDDSRAMGTEVWALVDPLSEINIIRKIDIDRLGEATNVDTRQLSRIEDLFREGPPRYRDFVVRGSTRLRIRFLEASSTTSEDYDYEDVFIVVDSLLPFSCIVGASLVTQGGLCLHRFEMPQSAPRRHLERLETTLSTLQEDYTRWLPDRLEDVGIENQLKRVLRRQALRLPGCQMLLPDQFPAFMDKEFGQLESVRQIVTLTGSLPDVWAATCEEYVSWRWEWASECILLLIDTIIEFQWKHHDQNHALRKYAIYQKKGFKPELKELESREKEKELLWDPNSFSSELLCFTISRTTIFTADGHRRLLLDIIEALAWFCTVLDVSDETKMIHSVTVEFAPFGDVEAPLKPKRKVLDQHQPENAQLKLGCCWYPVSPHYVVASGFPMPPRPPGMRGLELSFGLMSDICALEYSAFHGENFVLRGNLTALYPVLAVGGSLQWHLRYRAKQEVPFGEFLDDQEDQLNSQPPYSICDPEVLLKRSRHFLGLWPEAQITLGTNEHKYSSIRWSTVTEKAEIARKDANASALSLGFKGFISFTKSRTNKIVRTRRNLAGVVESGAVSFEDRLTSAVDRPVILYSHSEERAWMVPVTSVLLHLAHARAAYLSRKADKYGRSPKRNIPLCALQTDGGGAALNAILDNRETIVLEGETRTLEQEINLLWRALNFDDGERPRDSLLRPLLYGHEFMSIAVQDEPFLLKSQSLGLTRMGWAHLLNGLIPIVLYEGFSKDVIVPSQDSIAPHEHNRWPTIPKGLNLMAATLPCLEHLSTRWPSKSDKHIFINDDTYWHSPRPLFSSCDHLQDKDCNCVQILAQNTPPLSEARRPDEEIWHDNEQGVVVFQYQKRVPKTKSHPTRAADHHPANPKEPTTSLQQVNGNGPARTANAVPTEQPLERSATDFSEGSVPSMSKGKGKALDNLDHIGTTSNGAVAA